MNEMDLPELSIRGRHWPDVAKAEAIAVSVCVDVGIRFEVRNNLLDELVNLSLIGAWNEIGIVWKTEVNT